MLASSIMNDQHSDNDGKGCHSTHRTRRLAVGMLAAVLGTTLWMGQEAARADVCCNCSSASINLSATQVNPGESVTITYDTSYCRCVGAGGVCWHPSASCSLADAQVQVILDGTIVHQQAVSFGPTNDFNVGSSFSFDYTDRTSVV